MSDHEQDREVLGLEPGSTSQPPPSDPTWVDTVLAFIFLAALFFEALKTLLWLYFADR